MPTLARQLQWLIAIRLVVVTSVALPYFLLQIAPFLPAGVSPGAAEVTAESFPLLNGIAFVTYAASLLYIVLLRVLRQREALQAYIQFFGDLVLVTLLVYFFGGVTSPFSIFYPLVIAVATALLKRRSTVVATLAFVLYALLVLCLYLGYLPMADGRPLGRDPETLQRIFYSLAIHFFACYAVAFLTWALVASARNVERELEAKTVDLAALETKYRDVVESVTSGLITTDRLGRITSLNRAGQRILHRGPEQLLGRPVWESGLFSEARWQELAGAATGERGRLTSEVQVFREAAPIHVGYSVTELQNTEGQGVGWIMLFQDLTPWRKLEEEVRLNDRMAAVGTLAAGLAHEIGNPLAAISGSVQLLSRSSALDAEDARKLLAIVLKESQRLDRTVKRFLDYARPNRTSAVEFDIARLLEEHFELLRHSPELSAEHRLEIELDPPSALLWADPDGISQIFWNLARNALKAMPAGGTLAIHGRRHGEHYEVSFIDTGKGMGPEERANLFHPFHSFFDQGTGLGMAIVYRIVQDHDGSVSVESNPAGGHTRITVELPLRPTVMPPSPLPVASEV
jgi:two-component system, NtrC family, sensor histidine kinase PilS